jgi:hypothetical protein
MIRQGKWKLITYGRDPPYQAYVPLLFNLEDDPMELQNVAGDPRHADLIKDLDKLLRSAIDYPVVNAQMISEGRENTKRWISLYNSTEAWQVEVRKAYAAFSDADMAKFTRWLYATGEFAPSSNQVNNAENTLLV